VTQTATKLFETIAEAKEYFKEKGYAK